MYREREAIGLPAYPEPRAEINVSAGTNTIIAGVAGRKIRIYTLVFFPRAAANVILKDGTTTINGAGFNMPAQAGVVFDFPSRPLTLTAGNDFVITSTGGDLTGWVEYTQVA